MFVVTADQKNSRTTPDRVDDVLENLRDIPTLASFERTAGDEIQGVIESPAVLADTLIRLLRDDHWHIGVGLGTIDGQPASARQGSGSAYIAARDAVTAAKKIDPSLCLVGGGASERQAAELLARLVALTYQRRSDAQWDVVDRLESGQSGVNIAADLSISTAAVSQRRKAAAYDVTQHVPDVLTHLLTAWEASE